MKSPLISDPKPIESTLSSTDATRMYLLDQLFSENMRLSKETTGKTGSKDDSHPVPEMPMRNFLRVALVG